MAHTQETLARDVRAMGIKAGDVLMVHSGLKSIGWVEGGADAVIDAILSVIDKREGVLFVPTLTATFAASRWSDLVKHAFDPKQTPSRVGAITEVLRRRPDACRSDHPTHSLAAIGKDAAELMKGHGGDASTFDRRGPYGKYVRMNATVLFIGTGMKCNTTLHVSEDWAELPYMDQHSNALVRKGDRAVEVSLKMSPNGHRSFYVDDKDSPAARLFHGLDLVREGKLGDAKVQLIRAQDVINTMMRTYHDGDPAFLLCTKAECEFCRKGREACRRELPRIRKTVERLAADGWCKLD